MDTHKGVSQTRLTHFNSAIMLFSYAITGGLQLTVYVILLIFYSIFLKNILQKKEKYQVSFPSETLN